MTRDAARRLRLAKRAARDCLAQGGSSAQAAAAAQAFGTPCGEDSDTSDDSCGEDVEPEALTEPEATLADAVEQCSVEDGGAGGPTSMAVAEPAAAASKEAVEVT